LPFVNRSQDPDGRQVINESILEMANVLGNRTISRDEMAKY